MKDTAMTAAPALETMVGLGPCPGFLFLSLSVVTDISVSHYQRQILNLSQFSSLICLTPERTQLLLPLDTNRTAVSKSNKWVGRS